MKTVSTRACTLALLGAVSLSLLAHEARSQDYPPAFPREGARDNQRVTMWDRTWMPGQPASSRFFERNVVMIFANAGDRRLSGPGEQPQLTSFAEGAVLFLAGGVPRAIEPTNIAVRTLLVELK